MAITPRAVRSRTPAERRESVAHADTAQGIYAAFGRGDIGAILEQLAHYSRRDD